MKKPPPGRFFRTPARKNEISCGGANHRQFFQNSTNDKGVMVLPFGQMTTRTDIRSSLGPFCVFPDHQVRLPEWVVCALGDWFVEYNRAFTSLVEANREWPTDYQYCVQNGVAVNWLVQIDIAGLVDELGPTVANGSHQRLQQTMRRKIFEIENSVAMYQLLERAFAYSQEDSRFRLNFRHCLTAIRQKFNRPIVLLAVTHEKYEAVLQTEFGKQPGEVLGADEVYALSGFDSLWGPDELRMHLQQTNGECQVLLYVRASDPVSKLRKPDTTVEHPLLADPMYRRVIKGNTLTLNIDDPAWPIEDPRRINDSKAYLPKMQLGYRVSSEADLFEPWLVDQLARGRAYKDYGLNSEFYDYVESQGMEAMAWTGDLVLRAKPMTASYGCYGHLTGRLSDGKFRSELRRNIRLRGPYVIQVEQLQAQVDSYSFIDRIFFGMVDEQPKFIGGVRNFMPANSPEAQAKRIHGNSSAIYAEIFA